jgi:hypothetical protein
MKQGFKITFDRPDEVLHVVADGRDVRKWESQEAASYYDTPTSATKLAKVAHLAAVRDGRFKGSWKEFDERAVGVTPEALADPTQAETSTPKGRTDGTSATSRSDSESSRPNSKPKGKKS